MGIYIDFIPHKAQRYDTVGDWFYDPQGNLIIMISNDHPEYLDKKLQEAVALHELTEALLCAHVGVTQRDVDSFDLEWEQINKPGEPGESPSAPYHNQHMIADIVERVYIQESRRYTPANVRGTAGLYYPPTQPKEEP